MGDFLKSLCKSRGEACFKKGAFKKALAWFRRARMDERTGDALFQMGSYAEALEQYLRVGANDKAGDAALRAGDRRAAARHFARAGQYEKAVSALMEAGDPKGAVQIYLDHGMKAEAAALCKQTGQPKHAAALYLDLGDHAAAIQLFREAGDPQGLFEACKRKGDWAASAEECRVKGESQVAAALYELAGRFEIAGELFETCGQADQALEMYERANKQEKIAEIHKAKGNLHLAAAAYEKSPERQVEAAELYKALLVPNCVRRAQAGGKITRGTMARAADAAILITANREILYTKPAFDRVWKYQISGEHVSTKAAIAEDGAYVAVTAELPGEPANNFLLLLDGEKKEIWQKDFQEPVKDLLFLPGGAGLVIAVGDNVACLGLNGELLWERQTDFKAWALDLSPDGARLAAGTLGGGVFLYDAKGAPLSQTQLPERAHIVRFHPEADRLAVAAGDTGIFVLDAGNRVEWKFEAGERVRAMEWFAAQQTLAAVTACDFTILGPEGTALWSGPAPAKILTAFSRFREGLLYLSLENGEIEAYGALDCKSKAANCYAAAQRYAEAADIYREIGEFDKAYDLYREVGDYAKAASVLSEKGDVLTAARHYEAAGSFLEAAKLYEEGGAKSQAAKCYGQAGEYLRAAALFDELDDILLSADFYGKGGDRRRAGLLFNKAKQAEQAIANLEAWYQENAGDMEIAWTLGGLYFDAGHYDASIKMMQQASEDPERRRAALKQLGECFLKKGIHDVAIDRLNEALGPSPKPSKANIDLFYALGRTLEGAGRFLEAKDIFGKVMAIDYYYEDIQERLKQAEMMSSMNAGAGAPGPTGGGHVPHPGAPAATAAPVHTQRYKIIKKLGEGGMGIVYLAKDLMLNRLVAWKVLPTHMAANKDYQMRFLQEARAAALLRSRFIVAVYDIVTEGECFITMEYIDGSTLRKRLTQQPILPLRDALRYASQTAEALQSAHKANVIHRDVKPENVMLTGDSDEIRILDFGLARLKDDAGLTKEGCCVGTVRYMAPEQIRGQGVDHRVDIYALGVMLFEMLAGRTPFNGENILAQHLHDTPPLLSQHAENAPEPLVRLVDRCLKKDKDERPADCGVVIQEIADIVQVLNTGATQVLNRQ